MARILYKETVPPVKAKHPINGFRFKFIAVCGLGLTLIGSLDLWHHLGYLILLLIIMVLWHAIQRLLKNGKKI